MCVPLYVTRPVAQGLPGPNDVEGPPQGLTEKKRKKEKKSCTFCSDCVLQLRGCTMEGGQADSRIKSNKSKPPQLVNDSGCLVNELHSFDSAGKQRPLNDSK